MDPLVISCLRYPLWFERMIAKLAKRSSGRESDEIELRIEYRVPIFRAKSLFTFPASVMRVAAWARTIQNHPRILNSL